VAARIAMDMIIEMHFNLLWMLRVPVDGPTLLLGDNNSVILNTPVPSSILEKKHHACAYNWVQEAIAGGIMNFLHIKGTIIYANMLSKPLLNDAFHGLIKPLLFCVPKAGRKKEE
jgi:hypothetical protein